MPGHRTKGFCASAVAPALCALATGCGGSGETVSGGKVVLQYAWWGNPDRAERTEQAVALFEKEHPNIEVRTTFSAYDAYKQKLAVRASGGDAPDVMQLDYRQIDQYASGGILFDLAQQKAVLRTDDIDAGLLATGRVDASSTSAFGPMFAMSVIALLPIVMFFLAFQRFLVEGVASSGLKG